MCLRHIYKHIFMFSRRPFQYTLTNIYISPSKMSSEAYLPCVEVCMFCVLDECFDRLLNKLSAVSLYALFAVTASFAAFVGVFAVLFHSSDRFTGQVAYANVNLSVFMYACVDFPFLLFIMLLYANEKYTFFYAMYKPVWVVRGCLVLYMLVTIVGSSTQTDNSSGLMMFLGIIEFLLFVFGMILERQLQLYVLPNERTVAFVELTTANTPDQNLNKVMT